MKENIVNTKTTDWIKICIAICATSYFLYYTQSATEWHFIDNINLIFHEAGHTIFFFIGEFTQILAGSAFQILLPLVFVLYFYFKQNYFSSSLLLFWVGQNIVNVSVYIKDAQVMELPLLGGDNSIHDWNYILNSLGVIQNTDNIGKFVFYIGVLTIFLASYFTLLSSRKN